jgi:hypothetical protein
MLITAITIKSDKPDLIIAQHHATRSLQGNPAEKHISNYKWLKDIYVYS